MCAAVDVRMSIRALDPSGCFWLTSAFVMHCTEHPSPESIVSGPPTPAVLIGSVLNVPLRTELRPWRSVALTAMVYVVFGSRPRKNAVFSGEFAETLTVLA
jgi:hypothetical protein